MSNLTPPPERDLDPQQRQAIRAALLDARAASRRTPILAAAAVAAIVTAGLVLPQLGSGDRPQPAGSPTMTQTPTTNRTTATPRRTVSSTAAQRTGYRPTITRHPAKDPVAICRDAIRQSASPDEAPAGDAAVVARRDGRWGVSLILSDGRRWIGCDTAHYTYSGTPSLLSPRRVSSAPVGDVDAYAVSNVGLSEPSGAIYDHYFAAGVLPRGVASIRYRFPDGATETAIVNGRYWLVEHLASEPIPPNQSSHDLPRITVELLAADGSLVRRHRLAWGTHTCAHVNHGC